MSARIFVRRPILAIVISLIITVCGIVACFNLPVAQYPAITPPSISVDFSYPGANASTVEKSSVIQLESQLSGISNLMNMKSYSSDGRGYIKLTFDVGTNTDTAINQVLDRVRAATALLPSIVQSMGVQVEKRADNFLMIIGFYADPRSGINPNYMGTYLNRTVKNDLALIPGIGKINLWSDSMAIRIWLNLNNMNSLKVTRNDITTAIQEQDSEYPIGKSSLNPVSNSLITLDVSGSSMFQDPQQFANIIIRAKGNQIIRLKDVASVVMGSNYYDVIPQLKFRDGKQTKVDTMAGIQVFLDSDANELSVREAVLKSLAQDAKNFPGGLHYQILFDATQFIKASISNVEGALVEAFLLVGLVIFLFLHNYRSSLIALCTVPVSVFGAFACLYLFNSSINTLSLFALILAIGIVVDDAIVIVENIERVRLKYPQLKLAEAIILAMNEVFGAVIAIALVLTVTFIPIMFLGGLSGALYRQFAITIASTVAISAITALILTPALSHLFQNKVVTYGRFAQKFDLGLKKLTNFYLKIAAKFIDWKKTSLIVLVLISLITFGIFTIIPRSFVPNEDLGFLFVSVSLPSTSTLENTKHITNQVTDLLMKRPEVQHIVQIIGVDPMSNGQSAYSSMLIIVLKNWDRRHDKNQTTDALLIYANSLDSNYKNVSIKAFNVPPIPGLGMSGGVEFFLEDRTGGDVKALAKVADKLDASLKSQKQVMFAFHDLNADTQQIKLEPNIDQIKFYKANVQDVYNSLGAIYSTTFLNPSYAYIMQGLANVIMQAQYRFRKGIEQLSNIYIKNSDNQYIPIKSLVTLKHVKTAGTIEHYNTYLATQEVAYPKFGKYSSGDVMNVIGQVMAKLPKNYDYEWSGSSYMEKKSDNTSTLAFIFALSMIYLVLCALYEMWRLPWVVMMGVPFALFGAGIMLILRKQPNDLYFQISLITLMGLSAKNIILLIEFAHKKVMQGVDPKESILYALEIRFRPILMTSITFIMGALPLAFAHGAGCNAEHSVGTGIIGGMIGSVLLGTIFVPSYFVLIMNKYKREKHV